MQVWLAHRRRIASPAPFIMPISRELLGPPRNAARLLQTQRHEREAGKMFRAALTFGYNTGNGPNSITPHDDDRR